MGEQKRYANAKRSYRSRKTDADWIHLLLMAVVERAYIDLLWLVDMRQKGIRNGSVTAMKHDLRRFFFSNKKANDFFTLQKCCAILEHDQDFIQKMRNKAKKFEVL